MKRIVSSILLVTMILALCLGAMTGCKKEVPADHDFSQIKFDTNTSVTIKFYHSMGAALQGILNQAIEDFNKIYPNITVEHASYGDYDGIRNQIKTELTVGGQPNLAYCYPDHVALYNTAYAVQPLDELIAGEYGFTQDQINDFIPAYYNEGKAYADGKMYTLPMSKSTEVLYYNRSFFEEHDLAVPTTWDEVEAVCRQIKAIDSTCIPLGYDSEANWFITMCEQYGSPYTSLEGEHFLFDNETNRAFVKKFQSWYAEKLITTQALSGGYTSDLFKGSEKSKTRCYMCIGSTGGASYQQPAQQNGEFAFEVGIARIPQVNPDAPKVISQGPSVCIFKNQDPQKVLASWLFAKFLATDVTFQGGVSMSNGYAPVIKSVQQNEAYANFLANAEKNGTLHIQAYAVKVALEQADAYYVSPAFNGSADARDQVGLLMQQCLAAQGDVDAVIDQAFKKAVEECKYKAGH